MSDKPLVQQRLAADLAELLLLIQPAEEEARLEAALGFLAGFWESMVREWNGVDRLRWVYLQNTWPSYQWKLTLQEGLEADSIDRTNSTCS
jgi:ribosomal RNA-processing protein 1